jgi:TRAP-type C4-dicarboxylate transport system substrate-binding protein
LERREPDPEEAIMFSPRGAAATAGIAVLISIAACAPKAPDTATDGTTVLTVATATSANRPGAAQIEEFARQVQELSHGSIRIATQLQAAGDDTDAWNQAVAELVESGGVDMALIPTRTWEGEGVISFNALSAPFLVNNNDVLKQVVAPDFAAPMLAGLKPLGLSGLALFPEGPRYLFSFGDRIEDSGDLDGKIVRAPSSETTDEVLQAFGAVPKPLPGSLFTQALAANTVGATETSFSRASGLGKPTTAAGNLVLYSKANTLVINQGLLNGLTANERRTLAQAADATRAWATKTMPATAAEAAAYCQHGGSIFTAPAQGIAAFKAAAAPTITRLEKDPATKALIAKIRSLTAVTQAPAPLTPCGANQ